MLQRSVLLLVAAVSLRGATVSLTGSLDPNDANDVFLFQFQTPTISDLLFQSYGFGGGVNAGGTVIPSGGFDPYLSVFAGTGPTASFLASNDDGSCPPGNFDPTCSDPTLSLTAQPAGWYTVALTVFDNFSFAENFGSGTLGDGFIGLGDYFSVGSGSFRTSNFALDVSSSAGFVPEPGTVFLCAAGAALVFHFRRRKACLQPGNDD
jgi:hypothetical protein